jgi:RNA-directed DNA polymerase
MTTPRHSVSDRSAGSQVHGDAWSSDNVFCVNFNYGDVNNLNRNNKAFVRPVRSVSPSQCRDVHLKELYTALRAARRHKKPSENQLAFDANWMDGLLNLQWQLTAGSWSPRPTTCFIASRPKAREIHAPDFSDRVVHHWLVPKLEASYEPTFIHDSYAARRGKGTHAAVKRLQQFVRQVHSGQGGGWYLQLDISNYFNSINRRVLYSLLKDRLVRAGVSEPVLRAVHALLRYPLHRQGVIYRSTPAERAAVPAHKRLENAAPGCGIPIGNLSSQFFANVYLDRLDQFVKHQLKAARYLRYVDDFILIHRDRSVLEGWLADIRKFLADELKLTLKADIRLRPLSAGIDFLGYVTFPTHTRVRRRVLQHANEKLQDWSRQHLDKHGATGTPADYRQLQSLWASYCGHMRHANSWRLRQRFHRRLPWLASLTDVRRRFSYQLEGKRIHIRTRP